MQKLPNIWTDNDEFTRARRAKAVEHLRCWVEEYKKTAPEPKDVPLPDIRVEGRKQD
jgi:hypothetical protein